MAHVTQTEARVLAPAIHDRARFLWRLCSRTEKTGRTEDPLYPEVYQARDSVHGLWVSLHYRACEVGKPPEEGSSRGVVDGCGIGGGG